MPGMMDTVLNLGLNDKTVQALEKASGNPRFAWDSYRRFAIASNIMLGVEHALLRSRTGARQGTARQAWTRT